MRNVFIAHDNGQDTRDASRYLEDGGKIYKFAEGRKNVFHLDTLTREISEVFKKMQPNDCLLLGGNVIINSIVTAIVCAEFTAVNMLLWNYNNRGYILEVFDPHDINK